MSDDQTPEERAKGMKALMVEYFHLLPEWLTIPYPSRNRAKRERKKARRGKKK